MKIRSMRGVEIDMAAFLARNEDVVAVGNASMNARGDIIGAGGRVLKSRDEIAQEYHRSNPKAIRTVGLKDLANEAPKGSDKYAKEFADPVAVVQELTGKKPRKIEDTDD